jgi:hypothetical protein
LAAEKELKEIKNLVELLFRPHFYQTAQFMNLCNNLEGWQNGM